MTDSEKRKKRIRAAVRVTLLVIAALTVGLNVYGINASRLAGNTVPMPFGVGAAVVLSGSMEPELSVGDLLIVVSCDSYEPRDVIVYQDGQTAITHRIVSISNTAIVTRGDANNTDDDPITFEQVKGKVVFSIPLVGYLVNMIKTPLGTVAILGLAVFLLERSFRTQKENDKRQLDDIKAQIEKLKQEQNKDS